METSTTSVAPRVERTLSGGELLLVTLARLAITTTYRLLYPLLPFLSLRLGVDLQTVSVLVTVLVLVNLASPIGGYLADTRGERMAMSWGLALFCAGTIVCALAASFPAFLVGYTVVGLSVALYQPAAQSYLSSRTPYERRGLVLGIFEISWAMSALVGVAPLMWLVQVTDSSAPAYWILVGVGLFSFAMVRWALPATPRHTGRPRERIAWGSLLQARVLAILALLGLSVCAVDQFFVVQGAWLKSSFAADEAQLGLVFALMGVAELIGVLGSTVLVDRIGKKRATVLGFAATAVIIALLPLSEGSWALFLALLFAFDLAFEFAIVSSFPLASGVAPAVRGSVMAMSVAAIGIGRAVGSLTAEPLWRNAGMLANTTLAAVLIGAGVLLCVRYVRETERDADGD